MADHDHFRMRRADAAKIRRRSGELDLRAPVGEQREGMARLLGLTAVGMPDHRVDSVEFGGIAAVVVDAGSGTGDPIVFLHGGGYSLGSPETHRPLAARLSAKLGAPVLVPRYRQPPEHPCPAAVEDAFGFWRGLPFVPAALVGDSAGGGLALALAMAARDAGVPGPKAMVLLSPWTDLTLAGESIDRASPTDLLFTRAGLELMAARYAGPLELGDARVSPLWGEFAGLPPMLIQAGGAESLLDDSTRLAERALAAGVAVDLQVWPDQGHVFQATPMLSDANRALESIADWLARR